MKVSIVMPSLNQGRYLAQALASALAQDTPETPVEIVVADAGSTDETLEILRGYGDRVIWWSKPDKGQANALNLAIARSSGAVICALNCDDLLERGAAAKAVAWLQTHPDVDVCYGGAVWVDMAGAPIGPYPTLDSSEANWGVGCVISHPTAFVRRSALERFGCYDESLNYCLDYELWLRLFRGGARFHRIDDVFARVRLHRDAKTMRTIRPRYREQEQVLRRHGFAVPRDLYVAKWEERAERWGALKPAARKLFRPIAKLEHSLSRALPGRHRGFRG
jgi:glycosyltransferase involved in cell wall biosynthesis